jgi:ATP-dependent HslUV protease ATP-binding subunit HslU
VLNALVGDAASPATRESFRKKLRSNELDDKEIEIEVRDQSGMPQFDVPGMPGASIGVINIVGHVRQGIRRQDQDAPRHGQGQLPC